MLVLATRIDQHQLTILQRRIIIGVMQYARIGAAANNTRIGTVPGATVHKLINQFRFELRLGSASPAILHGPDMRLGADICGFAHYCYFSLTLNQALFMEQMFKGYKFPWRYCTPGFATADGGHIA